ncbi:threonine/serine exporter family protein [Treponema sp. HNW]|uniref:threonine/serine exporter family protein n=1 Tax=Treponema sp. HNW TaxID=3116654 RepID=UPI003D14CD4F
MSAAVLILSFVWGFGASFCYALIFNADYKGLLWTPFIGSLGWGLYTLLSSSAGMESFAYFAASFAVSALSEVFAVAVKCPATVFLIPGLIPLVPGGGMFQTMRAFVQGDMDTAARIGFTTLSAAGAIVLGLAIASSLAHILFVILRNVGKKTQKYT